MIRLDRPKGQAHWSVVWYSKRMRTVQKTGYKRKSVGLIVEIDCCFTMGIVVGQASKADLSEIKSADRAMTDKDSFCTCPIVRC